MEQRVNGVHTAFLVDLVLMVIKGHQEKPDRKETKEKWYVLFN